MSKILTKDEIASLRHSYEENGGGGWEPELMDSHEALRAELEEAAREITRLRARLEVEDLARELLRMAEEQEK